MPVSDSNESFIEKFASGELDPSSPPLEQPLPQVASEQPKPVDGSGDDYVDPNFVDGKTFRQMPEEAKKALAGRLNDVREERKRNAELMQQLAQTQEQLAQAVGRMADGQEANRQADQPKYNDEVGHRSNEELQQWAAASYAKAMQGIASDDADERAQAVELLQKAGRAREILSARQVQDAVAAQTQPLRDEMKAAQQAAAQREASDQRWLNAFGPEAMNDVSADGPRAKALEMVQGAVERGVVDANNEQALEAALFMAMQSVVNGQRQQKPDDTILSRHGMDLGGGPGQQGNMVQDPVKAAMERGDPDAAVREDIYRELRSQGLF